MSRRRYRTSRCVLHHEGYYLLAVHSSFWARRKRRWGLCGGTIEYGEHPQIAVQRELQEELSLHLEEFTEIGAYAYKGFDHMVYGAEAGYLVSDYDDRELLDLGWYNIDQIRFLNNQRKLHAGYELQAITQYEALRNDGA